MTRAQKSEVVAAAVRPWFPADWKVEATGLRRRRAEVFIGFPSRRDRHRGYSFRADDVDRAKREILAVFGCPCDGCRSTYRLPWDRRSPPA